MIISIDKEKAFDTLHPPIHDLNKNKNKAKNLSAN